MTTAADGISLETLLDTPVIPRMKRHRWLDAPYTDTSKIKVGDQVVRRARLSILDTFQMNAQELQAAFTALGLKWAAEYYDPKTRSLIVYHHGICCAPNEIVDFEGKGVRKVDFATFAQGHPIYVVDHQANGGGFVFPPKVIAARAAACLTSTPKLKWHRLYNNCDQWATYCATGRLHSVAVRGIINRVFSSVVKLAVFVVWLSWRHSWLFMLCVIALVVVCVIVYLRRSS